jgi:hypothetical protein
MQLRHQNRPCTCKGTEILVHVNPWNWRNHDARLFRRLWITPWLELRHSNCPIISQLPYVNIQHAGTVNRRVFFKKTDSSWRSHVQFDDCDTSFFHTEPVHRLLERQLFALPHNTSKKLARIFISRMWVVFVIFGTVVLHQLLLQHADLTIIWDSPCVADADRATGRVVELSFQLAVLLPRRRIFIYFTFATARFSHIVFVLISNCFTEVPQIPIHVTIYGCWWDTQALS